MTTTLAQAILDDRGRLLRLGTVVGRGGEGTVYEIVGQPNALAKIYNRPMSGERSAKISAMTSAATSELFDLCAWPKSLLSRRGTPIGLVMPRFDGRKELHVLHGPKSRKSAFPHVGFDFLVLVALNLAKSVAKLHDAGIVIGDVNERGFLASADGTVRVIDCDSFQVNLAGRTFPCDVGVPDYTPPELQGGSLTQMVRTIQHDCFGLAVLIFKLLFMGRHPFAGVYADGTKELHDAIAESRYAYSSNVARTRMKPPPKMLSVSEGAGQAVEALFEAAFSPLALPTSARIVHRPDASQWATALSRLKSQFADCKFNRAHTYVTTLSTCPWCEIEQRFGVDFFNFIPAKGCEADAIDVEAVWAALSSLQIPQPPTLLPEAFVRPVAVTPPGELTLLRSRLVSLESESKRAYDNAARLKSAHNAKKAAYERLRIDLSLASERVQDLTEWLSRLQGREGPLSFVLKIMLYAVGVIILGASVALTSSGLLLMAAFTLAMPRSIDALVTRFRTWQSVRVAGMLDAARINFIQEDAAIRALVEASAMSVRQADDEAGRAAVISSSFEAAVSNAKAALDSERNRLIAARSKHLEQADARVKSSKSSLVKLSSETADLRKDHEDRMRRLMPFRDHLATMTRDRDKSLRDLRNADKAGQLHQHLDLHYVRAASIQGITPALKSSLASFNIETAADVSEAAVSDVPGFGKVRTRRMLDWKNEVARKFVYKPAADLNPAAVAMIEAKFASGRFRIAKEFTAAHSELERRIRQHNEITARVKAVADEAVRALAQARAEFKSVSQV
jgi:DNA-binding helix-hairpin-helix protein with protein kinase domain